MPPQTLPDLIMLNTVTVLPYRYFFNRKLVPVDTANKCKLENQEILKNKYNQMNIYVFYVNVSAQVTVQVSSLLESVPHFKLVITGG